MVVNRFPYRAVLFDLDGTLYRGSEAIEGAVETVRNLLDRGVIVRYLTNNSSLTREQFAAKLREMGFPALAREVHSSASGTAVYLRHRNIEKAFVVGMPGLVATLRGVDIHVVNADSDGDVVPDGERAAAVVVGICRSFTYDLMNGAMQQCLRGATLVATNPDATFPLEGDRLVPGAGSLVAAVATCTGLTPFIVGKPSPFLITTILEEDGLSPSQALVVGDREDTDIAAGRAAGCPTYLVLTGVARSIPRGQNGGRDVTSLLSLSK